MTEKCLFCERDAVTMILLPGTKGANPVCNRHYIILSEKKEGKEPPKKPDTIPATIAPLAKKKKPPSDFTRVKLKPEMQDHLDKHFPNRPEGIRRVIKAHMKNTEVMADPESEKMRWFLVECYKEADGEINTFAEIISALKIGFKLDDNKAGERVNDILKAKYLWRLRDGSWKISPTKRDFSASNPLAELFG